MIVSKHIFLWPGIVVGLIYAMTSCVNHSGRIETFTYSTPPIDSITIPKYTEDFNDFISQCFIPQTIDDVIFAMLQYKPEESFTYPFEYDDDSNWLETITTSDSMIRFYNFHIYGSPSSTLIQYKGKNGCIVSDYFMLDRENEPDASCQGHSGDHLTEEEENYYNTPLSDGFVADVNTIVDDRGNTFYLVHFISSLYPQESFHYIVALNLVDGKPRQVPLFNTGRKRVGLIENYIVYYHSDTWKKADSMFVFNPETKKLYIPQIRDDKFQDKYLVYQFNGVEFKYMGVR